MALNPLKNCSRAVVACVLAGLVLVSGETVSQSAGQAGSFLRIGLGPRARAMGDAFTAVPENAVSPFYNPAGLGFLKNREATASYSVMSFDRRFNFAGYVSPLPPSAGYGLGILQSGFGSYDARSSNGEQTGKSIDDIQYAVFMGFAIRFTDRFSAGITPSWLYSKVYDVSSTSLGADLGLQYTPLRGLYLGYAVKHLFHRFNYVRDATGQGDQTTKDEIPQVTRYGASYFLETGSNVKRVLFVADWEEVKGQSARLHLGVEASVLDRAMVRLGMDARDFTAGLGIPFDWKGHRFSFDYAFIADSRSGVGFGSQDFAITYRF